MKTRGTTLIHLNLTQTVCMLTYYEPMVHEQPVRKTCVIPAHKGGITCTGISHFRLCGNTLHNRSFGCILSQSAGRFKRNKKVN